VTSPGQEAAADTRPEGRAWAAEGRLAEPAHKGWQLLGRKVARWGMMTAGRPVHGARMLPAFLIVGAERCGTTSMFHLLRQHPALFSATLPRKEVHYFDYKYHRGLAWYQCHFPLSVRARIAAGRVKAAPVAFEATPNYMFDANAPGRINRDLPGVKLLAMVRDPVERAYSAHAHQMGYGDETEPFERALELEDVRLEAEAGRLASDPAYAPRSSHDHHSYRTRGYYADQLDRLEALVGRERILVIDSGDFFTSPGPTYERVLKFLGVPDRGHPVFTPRNARPRSKMPEAVRAALEEHFRPYDERLTAWLGREPSWRR